MNDLSSTTLGRYHLIEKLGEGGMAVVYKAFDTRLECDVAVKVIRTDQLAPAILDIALKRFEREAKAVAQLTHPNIVKVSDYGEENNIPYLVMPFLSGGTLKQFLGKPLPYTQAAKLLVPIAGALQYAHLHNVIHRDVKPSNILITDSGEPMLTDFGIAKVLDMEGGHTLTGTGIGIGTPEYMAPEQGLGREVDGRTDIYALGVVFYELITGHKPYTADTPMAVVLMQSTEPIPRPSSFVEGLPVQIDDILSRAMAKKPENRYQEMNEFFTDLNSLIISGKENWNVLPLVHESSNADTDTYVTRMEEEPSPKPEKSALQDEKLPEKKSITPTLKRKSWFWLGGIAIVIVLILVTFRWVGAFSDLFAMATTETATVTSTPVDMPIILESTVTETITPSPTVTLTPAPPQVIFSAPTLTPTKTATERSSTNTPIPWAPTPIIIDWTMPVFFPTCPDGQICLD